MQQQRNSNESIDSTPLRFGSVNKHSASYQHLKSFKQNTLNSQLNTNNFNLESRSATSSSLDREPIKMHERNFSFDQKPDVISVFQKSKAQNNHIPSYHVQPKPLPPKQTLSVVDLVCQNSAAAITQNNKDQLQTQQACFKRMKAAIEALNRHYKTRIVHLNSQLEQMYANKECTREQIQKTFYHFRDQFNKGVKMNKQFEFCESQNINFDLEALFEQQSLKLFDTEQKMVKYEEMLTGQEKTSVDLQHRLQQTQQDLNQLSLQKYEENQEIKNQSGQSKEEINKLQGQVESLKALSDNFKRDLQKQNQRLFQVQETHQKSERNLVEAKMTIEMLREDLSQKQREHNQTIDSLKLKYNENLEAVQIDNVSRNDYQQVKQEYQQAQFELQKLSVDYKDQIEAINESWEEKYRQLDQEKDEFKSSKQQLENEVERLKMSIDEILGEHKNHSDDLQTQINQMIGQNVFLEQKLNERENLESELKKLKTKYLNQRKTVRGLESKCEQTTLLITELQTKNLEVEKKRTFFKQKVQWLVKNRSKQIGQLKVDLVEIKKSMSVQNQSILEEFQQNLQFLNQRIQSLSVSKLNKDKIVQNQQIKITELQKQIELLNLKQDQKQELITQNQAQITDLKNELDLLSNKQKNNIDTLQNRDRKYVDLQKKVKIKEAQINDLNVENRKLTAEQNELIQEKSKLDETNESLTFKLDEQKAQMRKVQSDCDKRIRGMKVKFTQTEKDLINKFSLRLDKKLNENQKALKVELSTQKLHLKQQVQSLMSNYCQLQGYTDNLEAQNGNLRAFIKKLQQEKVTHSRDIHRSVSQTILNNEWRKSRTSHSPLQRRQTLGQGAISSTTTSNLDTVRKQFAESPAAGGGTFSQTMAFTSLPVSKRTSPATQQQDRLSGVSQYGNQIMTLRELQNPKSTRQTSMNDQLQYDLERQILGETLNDFGPVDPKSTIKLIDMDTDLRQQIKRFASNFTDPTKNDNLAFSIGNTNPLLNSQQDSSKLVKQDAFQEARQEEQLQEQVDTGEFHDPITTTKKIQQQSFSYKFCSQHSSQSSSANHQKSASESFEARLYLQQNNEGVNVCQNNRPSILSSQSKKESASQEDTYDDSKQKQKIMQQ